MTDIAPLTSDELQKLNDLASKDPTSGASSPSANSTPSVTASPASVPPLTPDELTKLNSLPPDHPAVTNYPDPSGLSPAFQGQSLTPADPDAFPGPVESTGRMLLSDLPGSLDRLIAYGKKGDYYQNLQNEQWRNQDVARNNPELQPILGAIGAAPFFMLTGGGGALSEGSSLAANIGKGALTGGIYGGLQGAATSPDLTNTQDVIDRTLKGGGSGAIFGGAVPIASRVGGGMLSDIGNTMEPPPTGISRAAANGPQGLLSTFSYDNAVSPVQTTLNKLGDKGMLLDAGTNMEGAAKGAMMNSPSAMAQGTNALNTRLEQVPSIINQDLNQTLGPNTEARVASADLKSQRSDEHAALPQIFAATPNIDPQIVSGIINDIDDKLKTAALGGPEYNALTKAKNMLLGGDMGTPPTPATRTTVPGSGATSVFTPASPGSPPLPVTNSETLNEVKKVMSNWVNQGDQGLQIPPGSLQTATGSTKDIIRQLDEGLRTNVPGYADAMDASSALARKNDAIKEGYTTLLQGGNNPVGPQWLQDRYAQAAIDNQPEIREGHQIGTTAAIYRDVGKKVNDAVSLKNNLGVAPGQTDFGPPSWNQQILSQVHSPQTVQDLSDTYDKAATFAKKQAQVVGGAQTAIREAAARGQNPNPLNVNGLIGTTGLGALLSGGKRILGSALKNVLPDSNATMNERINVLTSQGSQRDAYINAMVDALRRQGENTTVANMTGKLGAYIAALQGQKFINPTPQVQNPNGNQ